MIRLTRPDLVSLVGQLGDRELAILTAVEQLRLLRGDQARKLFFHDVESESGAARLCRRSLKRLVAQGLLARLDGRRVGGVRAGSGGHVYTLTASGRRLHAYRNGVGTASNRGVYEPGIPFVAHTLAIADLYVTLIEADRAGALELLAFEAEPVCWRQLTSTFGSTLTLKPDACIRLASGAYEYAAFAEIDCGTVGKGSLQRKARTYIDYFRSGREQDQTGLFPKVVWIANSDARATMLRSLLRETSPDARQLFTVVTSGRSIEALLGGEGVDT